MTGKRIFVFFLMFLFIALLLINCESEKTKSATSKKEKSGQFDLSAMGKIIQDKNKQFTEAHVTGDHEAIDTLFTLDAKSFPPNAEPVIGRSAIATLTAEYIKYEVSEFHEETVEIYGGENLLIDQGTYTMTYGPDNTVEKGKYLNVWKKVGNEWKIYSNMWNTNE